MGHTYVKARFYNPADYLEYAQGKRPLTQVRQAEVQALVDTGATFPALPEAVAQALGLVIVKEIALETFDGRRRVKLTSAWIEIEDKSATCYVVISPADTVPLIGVVALEQMGYKVDPATGKLIPGLALMMSQWLI